MSEYPNIAVIGPGAMGEAIIAGLLRNGLKTPMQIYASGPLIDRGKEIGERYGVHSIHDNKEAVKSAGVVILSVKPQTINQVLADLHGCIPQDALVFSIVAGVTIEMISRGLAHEAVVRAMPNTPAQIGEGITVWTDSAAVNDRQRELARMVLSALGEEVYVDDESYLDMATALSGSGPAYVFLFMEAMIDAGVHLGFSRRISEELVMQTIRGSVNYFDKKRHHPAELRNEVTSPAGTSAAALYYLEKAGFRTAISRAVWAAYERCVELGKGRNSQMPENT
ncbi:MAG: pyrroline-5-carboxylate reductase [Chloroflexi bacterium]|nr:pyrroline-5-carboxylate reductase [Chloroflexota bacterium]